MVSLTFGLRGCRNQSIKLIMSHLIISPLVPLPVPAGTIQAPGELHHQYEYRSKRQGPRRDERRN